MNNYLGIVKWRFKKEDDSTRSKFEVCYGHLPYSGESMSQAALHFDQVIVERLSKRDCKYSDGELVRVDRQEHLSTPIDLVLN